jgi:hypothetical protein
MGLKMFVFQAVNKQDVCIGEQASLLQLHLRGTFAAFVFVYVCLTVFFFQFLGVYDRWRSGGAGVAVDSLFAAV